MDLDLEKIEGFDWYNGNLEHIKKHNVSRDECEEVFLNEPPIITEDESHSDVEKRYRVYSQTHEGRLLFITTTFREAKIRVISARDQNRKERKEFELTGGEEL